MSPRSSRSRSPREDRRRNRSRTPLNGSARYNDAGDAPASHGLKDTQQDRRVYVGNLSYEVKWPQLKEYMRNGIFRPLSFGNLEVNGVSW
jgi:RNA recognition motif-containing protein